MNSEDELYKQLLESLRRDLLQTHIKPLPTPSAPEKQHKTGIPALDELREQWNKK